MWLYMRAASTLDIFGIGPVNLYGGISGLCVWLLVTCGNIEVLGQGVWWAWGTEAAQPDSKLSLEMSVTKLACLQLLAVTDSAEISGKLVMLGHWPGRAVG